MSRSLLLIDVGSTSTKAHLIDGDRIETQYAATTVEKPFEDVMVGVRRAVEGLENRVGRKLLGQVDIFLATSSAGGGLQMLVGGLVGRITARSAERTALSSGAIVMDILSVDDGRSSYGRIEMIKNTRPDMILLAGGEDGGAVSGVARMAEVISTAKPTSKYTEKIPLVYAGNIFAREYVENTLRGTVTVYHTENVRPKVDEENPVPARNKIHEIFMQHVMSRAPGYDKLTELVDAPILPTPSAVHRMVAEIARRWEINLLAVDMGGATTDVFSVIDGVENRTVSANLGMSYSMGNVYYQAGPENVKRWIGGDISTDVLKNAVMNKVLHPTSLPQTDMQFSVENAVAREAMRLALRYHRDFIEAKRAKYLLDIFGKHLKPGFPLPYRMAKVGKVDWEPGKIDLIVGSGGALSYAPRENALSMIIDAFEPTGITKIGVDNRFLMPHLGVLSTVDSGLAWELFERFCYVPLGTCIGPVCKMKEEEEAVSIEGLVTLKKGDITKIHLDGEYKIIPGSKGDLGEGRGRSVSTALHGDVVIDARGRPIGE
jgi:uncharacterized protein (TIGR01319 family)